MGTITRRELLRFAAILGGALTLGGCDGAEKPVSATELMPSPAKRDGAGAIPVLAEGQLSASYDLAVNLLRQSSSEENVLLSPLSATFALAMLANGAAGQTLAQIEQVAGMDAAALTELLASYLAFIDGNGACPLSLANSVWLRQDDALEVEGAFLATCADDLGASVFEAPFDSSTVSDINNWVSNHTQELIPQILDQIAGNALLYLVNALAFDAEWSDPYEDAQVEQHEFHPLDAEAQQIELMRSRESRYLENEQFTGFMRPYKNWSFAFVGLLPKEEVDPLEALGSLSGGEFVQLLDPINYTVVDAGLPKFSLEYGTELAEALAALGMPDAFDVDAADLSAMGSHPSGNLYVSRVIHKTFIEVNERGTKAAAATAIENSSGSAGPSESEPEVKEVVLDRPFLYLIVDDDTGLPVFIGTVNSLG